MKEKVEESDLFAEACKQVTLLKLEEFTSGENRDLGKALCLVTESLPLQNITEKDQTSEEQLEMYWNHFTEHVTL